jgi:hypothetical protein
MYDNTYFRNKQHVMFSLNVKYVTCMKSIPNFGILVIKKEPLVLGI